MGLLDNLKVIDLSTLFAGPFCATLLGDHGAEVIKIEHPKGDDIRKWGESKNGIPLWWKVVSRNKKLIAIDLHKEIGRNIVKSLVQDADVLIENFRPGKMEQWGLDYNSLREINKRLIYVKVTGFGNSGPYSKFPGFGTLAEAMSGFAEVTGFPDGPPTLPAFGLADGVAGIAAAFSVTSALYKREQTGEGEFIDVSLYEPLMWIVGAHIIEYDQLMKIQGRQGNRSPRTAPRNVYKTLDNRWVALSASAESVARRLFQFIGRMDIIEKYPTNTDRIKHIDEVDMAVTEWMKLHNQNEIIDLLRDGDIAVAPIYNAEQIYNDLHFQERESIISLFDEDLGEIRMQGIFPKVLNYPGKVKYAGRTKIGYNTVEILRKYGYSEECITKLKNEGVIT
jgi:crotonobetainyl-CoA:carnitine CoA-transferase CaiB-like acyl-CoA transferase